MAKDKGGHGSEKRGVSATQARNDRMFAMFDRAKAQGHTGLYSGPTPDVPGYTSRGAKLLQSVMSRGVTASNPPIVEIPAHSGGQPVASDAHAAATLASGVKSAPVDTHPSMTSAQRADAAGSPNYRGSGTGPGGIGERVLTTRDVTSRGSKARFLKSGAGR